jgi:hypothetical protein
MRAAQQAHHTPLIARHNPATAATRRGPAGPGHPSGSGSGTGPAASAAGPASGGGAAGGGAAAAGTAAGPAGAVVAGAAVATRAARTTGRKVAATAERATSAQPSPATERSGTRGAVRQVQWGARGRATPDDSGPGTRAPSTARRGTLPPPGETRGPGGVGR